MFTVCLKIYACLSNIYACIYDIGAYKWVCLRFYSNKFVKYLFSSQFIACNILKRCSDVNRWIDEMFYDLNLVMMNINYYNTLLDRDLCLYRKVQELITTLTWHEWVEFFIFIFSINRKHHMWKFLQQKIFLARLIRYIPITDGETAVKYKTLYLNFHKKNNTPLSLT